MKHDVVNLDSKKVGTIELNKDIFSVPIRKDILKDVVNWQLSNRRQGTHKAKQRSEITGTSAKAFKQKGTGRARRGNLKTNILRGGGVTHGPVLRSHKKKLPKKIRKLGLKTALSVKEKEKSIIIIDKLSINKASTKEISKKLEKLKVKSALIIDSNSNKDDKGFKKSILNITNINLIPVIGMNVHDILKFKNLIISKDALVEVEKRLI
ncbi:MAG: 50S ribosomal protein L4 [Alphaproteobacteria bacterium MarineAlpha6_Bin6]|nr:50S ribosomal protein L4 [Pelagibacteraceae bacterium]PPR31705.1 MAG: 50S ribosomal protein L4 [Alphaproteobacteria bacterium MarineAlpha6_Bin6]PPR32664.1 MAG: 50S ribosomal protein L4 [Alphaproteobacteria bacterium MarineAlpha6_Bin5]|tara:strand:- start:34 stop:660 length:627 start_codon:yes stop_codon:yes gene_type:complete